MRRSTSEAKEAMTKSKILDWSEVVSSRQAKWKARLETLDPRKCANKSTIACLLGSDASVALFKDGRKTISVVGCIALL